MSHLWGTCSHPNFLIRVNKFAEIFRTMEKGSFQSSTWIWRITFHEVGLSVALPLKRCSTGWPWAKLWHGWESTSQGFMAPESYSLGKDHFQLLGEKVRPWGCGLPREGSTLQLWESEIGYCLWRRQVVGWDWCKKKGNSNSVWEPHGWKVKWKCPLISTAGWVTREEVVYSKGYLSI